MRRSNKNRLLMAVALGIVLWFVLSRLRFFVVVSLSLTQFLILIIIGIGLLYFLLKLIF